MSEDVADEVRAAITEIHREQLKAAAIVAAIDASLALVAVSLALSIVDIGPIRSPVLGPIRGFVLVAILVALIVGVLQFRRSVRAPAVERFEAANPAVAEALRTARDAVAADRDGPVKRRLYHDVIERLRTTSSRDLLPWRRLGVTLAVVGVLAGAALGVQVAGIAVTGLPDVGIGGDGSGDDDSGVDPGAGEDPPEVLQPGDSILGGSPGEITLGEENLTLAIEALIGGQGDTESPNGTDGDGLPDEQEPLEPQPAGYSPPEPVEDAELIREYTLAIQRGNTTNE